jgi:hypothetical protein
MNSNKEVTLKELILGFVVIALSYFIIAVLNISNEDIYNMDLNLIFTKGGWFNSLAFISFCLWFVITSLWLLSVVIRIIRAFIR